MLYTISLLKTISLHKIISLLKISLSPGKVTHIPRHPQ